MSRGHKRVRRAQSSGSVAHYRRKVYVFVLEHGETLPKNASNRTLIEAVCRHRNLEIPTKGGHGAGFKDFVREHVDLQMPLHPRPGARTAKSHKNFYETERWRRLRYEALKIHGRRCLVCGAGPHSGAILHVDHIEPRSKRPDLELSLTNLQVLCEDCNLGKSNRDNIDWRVPTVASDDTEPQ